MVSRAPYAPYAPASSVLRQAWEVDGRADPEHVSVLLHGFDAGYRGMPAHRCPFQHPTARQRWLEFHDTGRRAGEAAAANRPAAPWWERGQYA